MTAEVFNLNEFKCIRLLLWIMLLMLHLRKSCLIQAHKDFLLCFPSGIRIIVLCCGFRSAIYFELIFAYAIQIEALFQCVCMDIQHHLLKWLSFLCWIAFVTESHVVVHGCGSGPGLSSVPLVSVFLSVPRCFDCWCLRSTFWNRSHCPSHSHYFTTVWTIQVLCISTWILESTCRFLLRSRLGVELRLCWVCRWAWGGGLTFQILSLLTPE